MNLSLTHIWLPRQHGCALEHHSPGTRHWAARHAGSGVSVGSGTNSCTGLGSDGWPSNGSDWSATSGVRDGAACAVTGVTQVTVPRRAAATAKAAAAATVRRAGRRHRGRDRPAGWAPMSVGMGGGDDRRGRRHCHAPRRAGGGRAFGARRAASRTGAGRWPTGDTPRAREGGGGGKGVGGTGAGNHSTGRESGVCGGVCVRDGVRAGPSVTA